MILNKQTPHSAIFHSFNIMLLKRGFQADSQSAYSPVADRHQEPAELDDQSGFSRLFCHRRPYLFKTELSGPSLDIREIDDVRRDLENAGDIAEVLVGTPLPIEVQLLQD